MPWYILMRNTKEREMNVPDEAIEAATLAAAETRIMRPNGNDMPAISAIACGLNDYREDRRYAVADVRQIAEVSIAAYLRARAELADKGPIGEWPRMLRALAAEVERHPDSP